MSTDCLTLCDLTLLWSSSRRGWSASEIARRERDIRRDLRTLLPTLLSLQHSELATSVVPDGDGFRLRLSLVAGQRGLAFGGVTALGSMEGERQQLLQEIAQCPLKVRGAEKALLRRIDEGLCGPLDPEQAVLFRRSLQTWRWHLESGQVELPFAEAPRLYEDGRAYYVDGIVDSTTIHQVTLKKVSIRVADEPNSPIVALPRLPVARATSASDAAAAESASSHWHCGTFVSAAVTLARCIVTGRAVGAVEQHERR